GVDVVDGGTVNLHFAHVWLDTLLELVCAGGADRHGATGSAFCRGPVAIAHRHAMPRIEEARRTPVGPGPAGRESFAAGPLIRPLGEATPARPHVPAPFCSLKGCGTALVNAQCRALFPCRFRVVLDGDVSMTVGNPSAERDQVVLCGRLGLPELALPTLVDRAPDQHEPRDKQQGDYSNGDQNIA